MARRPKHFDADALRDRSEEAAALLHGAVVARGAFPDLEGPFKTSPTSDTIGKADWYFRWRVPDHEPIRPSGLVYAGARFLANRGWNDEFVGKYLIISAQEGKQTPDEYSVWKDGTCKPPRDGHYPNYWFYLTAWTDGPNGGILAWSVVDMLWWTVRHHVLVEDAAAAYGADPKSWVDRMALPCDERQHEEGRAFYRFPMAALKVVGDSW